MSKYIIDIPDSVKKIVYFHVGNANAIWTTSNILDDLEELNSDYINEHYGVLQDEAYQKGYDKGYADKTNNDEVGKELAKDVYQRGLDDAWEAARKIIRMSDGDILDLFPNCYASVCTAVQVILKYDASEAIAKLKAYEEKKADDEIKVGDEVEWDNDFTGDRFIVTRIYQPYGKKEQCDGIDDDGDVYRAVLIENIVKTGRHFDIESILEDMRE